MEDLPRLASEHIAGLVGSRLCHDLVSPLGAIGNGVELMGMAGQEKSPEMALIEDAVRDAQARIRFFRIAFGAASGDQLISQREIGEIVAGLHGQGRLRVNWLMQGDLPRPEVKIAFLALNCAETALPMGGAIEVTGEDGALRISAVGPRVMMDEETWDVLTGLPPGRALRPADVQFALLATETARLNRPMHVERREDGFTLSL